MTPKTRAMIENVAELLRSGDDPERIAARLDTTPAALTRRLYRAGRKDLAAPFGALTARQRARRSKRTCITCGKPRAPHSPDPRRKRCLSCAAIEREANKKRQETTHEHQHPRAS